MEKKTKRQRFLEKLKNHYRLIIYNDSTFQTVWSIRLTRLRVFTIVVLSSVLVVIITTIIIALTPLRERIPGYPTPEERAQIIQNAIALDSLEEQIVMRDRYFEKIKVLIQGDVPQEEQTDTAVALSDVKFRKYNPDSVFQKKIQEEQLELSVSKEDRRIRNIAGIHFFTPVKGIVTDRFNEAKGHHAVDVIGQPNSRISAVLDGTIVFADYTVSTGYVIYIQHENNLISVYKHNAELLKSVGDKVKAGEAIAIMGNSGELTTGPHLHFELWYNGVAVNPEMYIDF